jgi:hypothetical protein
MLARVQLRLPVPPMSDSSPSRISAFSDTRLRCALAGDTQDSVLFAVEPRRGHFESREAMGTGTCRRRAERWKIRQDRFHAVYDRFSPFTAGAAREKACQSRGLENHAMKSPFKNGGNGKNGPRKSTFESTPEGLRGLRGFRHPLRPLPRCRGEDILVSAGRLALFALFALPPRPVRARQLAQLALVRYPTRLWVSSAQHQILNHLSTGRAPLRWRVFHVSRIISSTAVRGGGRLELVRYARPDASSAGAIGLFAGLTT